MASNEKKAKKNRRKTGTTGVEKSKKNGQFLAGNNGGSGRPKGSIDFMTSFTIWAETQKMTAGEAAQKLIQRLWDMAFNDGNMKAFQILAERVFGGIERGPLLAVQINTSPAIPQAKELAVHLVEAYRTAKELGLLAEPEDV